MASEDDLRIAARRRARGLTQAELGRQAGLPRSSIGAIESGRLRPSVDAALAVARALECSVEDLFGAPPEAPSAGAAWAWSPPSASARFWTAEVVGRRLRYPVESGPGLVVPHDGKGDRRAPDAPAAPTLVVAGCDPAAGLLAVEYHAATGHRLLSFPRSGAAALDLLGQGLVHAAALHRSTEGDPECNARTVRERLGGGYRLLRLARWQAGVVLTERLRAVGRAGRFGQIRRWAAREVGSAARECLEELLGGPLPRQRAWPGHAAVAMAVREGFADAGVCIQLCAEEAGLPFVPVRTESLDLCFPAAIDGDPRLQALLRLVGSRAHRQRLRDLPGYDATHTGALASVCPP
ncbi:MAG: helix-turn-helix domain-containing protein [Planctomycetes bacterium]|nr:helix-turn-helix domain-containing protein [Planctomycetota bacterium]